MNVKIHNASSGTYNNSGSSRNLAEYIDKERKAGKSEELYFNHENYNISKLEVINDIDSNKGQLRKEQAKFYAITISPSAQELKHLGSTKEEQAKNIKSYINDEVMQKYAENFSKGLNKEDLKYYAKVHYKRERNDNDNNMHVHIIVSRKDKENKIKLSPLTNHRGTQRGAVKGGFERIKFYDNCEKAFDNKFEYNRDLEESFKYLKAMKYGRLEELKQIKQERVQEHGHKQELKQEQEQDRQQKQEQGKQQERIFGLGM